MCAHYVGLSDEEIDALVARLSGERHERVVKQVPEPEIAAYEQRELDYPDPVEHRARTEVENSAHTEREWIDVYPKHVSPVIVPTFDTAVGVAQFEPGALECADLTWGYSSQWNPRPMFNTRIESADKPIWRASIEHERCIIACRQFYESSGTETRVSERTGRTIKQQYVFTIPFIKPVADAGLRGQFRFLRKPGPWFVLVAVFAGNTGIFCWWSYVSPWLQCEGGWPSNMVSMLMMLAGFGMVVGGLCGGRIADHWHAGATSSLGQFVAMLGLLAVFFVPGNLVGTAVLTFVISFGLFFVSAPQQLLMAESGKGGGELIGGAAVQIAFNFGNAVGSLVGGAVLDATSMDYRYPALGGVPFAAVAVLLLALYALRYERGDRAHMDVSRTV